MRPLILIVAISSAACAASVPPRQPPQQEQLVAAVSPPSRMEPPEYLSPSARALLKTRMGNHAFRMSDLVSAIMILDYPRIRERAEELRDDARLARPLTGDATELNSALPEKFFVYQDELRTNAQALVTAATRMRALEVAEAYGQLSQNCVRCHAVYRQGP